MSWLTQPEVKLGGHVLVGASVAHRPRAVSWRGAAPLEATVTGTALVRDLAAIHEDISVMEARLVVSG